jgi:hypothetical protein
MTVGQLPGIEADYFFSELVGRFEAVRPGVIVGKGSELHLFDLCYPDISGAGNVAALPGPHLSVFPQSDGLGLLTGAYGGQEFFLEQKHSNSLSAPKRRASLPDACAGQDFQIKSLETERPV